MVLTTDGGSGAVNNSLEEIILLHIDESESDATLRSVGETVGIGDGEMARRFEVLSVFDELINKNHIEHATTEGSDNRSYLLTDDGQQRVSEIKDGLIDIQITVVKGGKEEDIQLSQVEQYIETETETPIAYALARLTDSGMLYIGDVSDEFINRTEEIETVESVIEIAAGGDPPCPLLVTGQPGIGKSHFINTASDIAAEKGFQVVTATSDREGDTGYGPFEDIFAELDIGTSVLDRKEPDLEESGQFEGQRKAIFDDLTESLQESATETPCFIGIDDLHTAPDPTIEFFHYLADNLPSSIVLVGGARQGREQLESLTDENIVTELPLDTFNVEHTREVIEGEVGVRGAPDDFVEMVHEYTGGNPLFISEITAHLYDIGKLTPGYDKLPEEKEELPTADIVEEAIETRLNKMPSEVKDILNIGALLGTTFQREVLINASPLSDSRTKEYIDLLEKGGFWRDEQETIHFESGVLRETIRQNTTPEEKSDLESRLATALSDADADPSAIAHHYYETGEYEQAFHYYRKAAERARDTYAYELAKEYENEALSIAQVKLDKDDDDTEVLATLEDLAHAERILGYYDEADRYYRYITEATEDAETIREIARQRAEMKNHVGDYKEAIKIVGDAIERYGKKEDAETVFMLCTLTWSHNELGKFDKAKEIARDARRIADRIDDTLATAQALHSLATVDVIQRKASEEAVELLEEAAVLKHEIDEKAELARTMNNLALAYFNLNRLEDGMKAAKRSISIRNEINDHVRVVRTLLNVGMINYHSGNLDKAEKYNRMTIKTAEKVGDIDTAISARCNLSDALLQRGNLQQAEEIAREALNLIENNPYRKIGLVNSLAQILRLRGKYDEALEMVENIYPTAQEVGGSQFAVLARTRGLLHRSIDNYEQAETWYTKSIDIAEDLNEQRKVEALSGLIEVKIAHQSHETALEMANEAVAKAEATDRTELELIARHRRGKAHRVNGNIDQANDDIAWALERADETGNLPVKSASLMEMAQIQAAQNNTDKAKDFANQAIEIANHMDSPHLLDQSRKVAEEIGVDNELEVQTNNNI